MIRRVFNNLKPREQGIVIVGGAAAILILLYAYAVDPLLQRNAALDRLITQKGKQYQELLVLQKEYSGLKKQHEELEKNASRTQKDFSPLSFMEGLSTQAGIRDRVVSMKPRFTPVGEDYRESSIEVKAERLTLPQTVSYLHRIENSGMPIRIKTLHLKTRFDDPSQADLTVVVSSLERVKS